MSHGHKFNMSAHCKTSAPAQDDANVTLHNPSEKKRGLMRIIEQDIQERKVEHEHTARGSQSAA